MTTVHLTKVAFACRDLEMLQQRIAGRAVNGEVRVVTRMRPKRADELIGGSIYWIVKHRLVGRQEILRFEERKDGSAVIHQQILVARDSQKAIVLGKGGTRIRAIGEAARAELAQLLGRKVHLFLHVKVNPKWEEDRGLYREIGLDWVE